MHSEAFWDVFSSLKKKKGEAEPSKVGGATAPLLLPLWIIIDIQRTERVNQLQSINQSDNESCMHYIIHNAAQINDILYDTFYDILCDLCMHD